MVFKAKPESHEQDGEKLLREHGRVS